MICVLIFHLASYADVIVFFLVCSAVILKLYKSVFIYLFVITSL